MPWWPSVFIHVDVLLFLLLSTIIICSLLLCTFSSAAGSMLKLKLLFLFHFTFSAIYKHFLCGFFRVRKNLNWCRRMQHVMVFFEKIIGHLLSFKALVGLLGTTTKERYSFIKSLVHLFHDMSVTHGASWCYEHGSDVTWMKTLHFLFCMFFLRSTLVVVWWRTITHLLVLFSTVTLAVSLPFCLIWRSRHHVIVDATKEVVDGGDQKEKGSRLVRAEGQ